MTTVEWWPLGHLPPLGSGSVSPNSAVHQLTNQFCSSFYSEVGKHFPGVYCTLCFQATPRVAQPLQSLGFLPTSPNLSLNQHSVSAAVSPQRLLPTCLNLLVSRVTGSCRAHCRGQGRASGGMACTLHVHLTCLPTIFWLLPRLTFPSARKVPAPSPFPSWMLRPSGYTVSSWNVGSALPHSAYLLAKQTWARSRIYKAVP